VLRGRRNVVVVGGVEAAVGEGAGIEHVPDQD